MHPERIVIYIGAAVIVVFVTIAIALGAIIADARPSVSVHDFVVPAHEQQTIDVSSPTSTPITIRHFGDMMLGRHVGVLAQRNGFDWLFAPMVSTTPDFFSSADLTVVNLEGPFTDYPIVTSKEIAFQFDPVYVPLVADLGIDLVSLANNHAQDMGSAAFAETKEHLASSSIRYAGEQYAVNSSSLHYETIASRTIAFVAINDTHPGTDIDSAMKLIGEAEETADLTIVTIHWGAEYQLLSNTHQQTLAHQFINSGADAVIGHHPHVVQEIEIYNDAPIVYSLGNMVFDQYFSTDTQQGMGVEFTITSSTIDSIEVLPFKTVYSQITPMEAQEKTMFLEGLFERSRLGEYTVSSTTIFLQL